jgi:chemotaxis protein methyltransferase CheR
MSGEDFARLAAFIESKLGIRMPEVKRVMLESRLHRRLRSLGFASYAQYIDYVFSSGSETGELQNMIDAVTTNKTEFFREPDHFDVLETSILPELVGTGKRNLRIWSAGCSTGEEPYTIAMTVSDFLERTSCGLSAEVVASDISWQVLEKAREAVYPMDRVHTLGEDRKRRYFLRSRDKERNLVRVKPHIRKLVSFFQLNLMEDSYPFPKPFDVVFCRNVIIYFDRATQERILRRICDHISVGGFLFLGHSEALTGLALPLRTVATTVHRKVAVGGSANA